MDRLNNKYENEMNLKETHKDDTTRRLVAFRIQIDAYIQYFINRGKKVTFTFRKIICNRYDYNDYTTIMFCDYNNKK